LQTWYTFTITKNDALLDDDDLLIGDGLYLLKYGSAYQDVEVDTAVNINCKLRTKTFGFNDGITYGRLRFFYINFVTSPSNVIFRIVDTDLNVNRELTLTNIVSKPITIKRVTDALTGSMKKFKKLYFEIEGVGIRELFGMKIEFRTVRLEDYPSQQNILVDENEVEVVTENDIQIEL
jgi:hypothetical protein